MQSLQRSVLAMVCVAAAGCGAVRDTVSPPPPSSTAVASPAEGTDPNFIPARKPNEQQLSKLWDTAVQQCYNANFINVNHDRTTKNIICTKPSDQQTISLRVRFVDEGIHITLNISGAAFALLGKVFGGGAKTTEHRDMRIILTNVLRSEGLLPGEGPARGSATPAPRESVVSPTPVSTAPPLAPSATPRVEPSAAAPKGLISLVDAQRRLSELRYQPGPADGVLGRRTTDALRKFQKDRGLVQSGALDAATSEALRK